MGAGFITCEECGIAVGKSSIQHHACDPRRAHVYRVDKQMAELASELDKLEEEIGKHLDSIEGKFDAYYAEHRR